jgi:hypothetical protein
MTKARLSWFTGKEIKSARDTTLHQEYLYTTEQLIRTPGYSDVTYTKLRKQRSAIETEIRKRKFK